MVSGGISKILRKKIKTRDQRFLDEISFDEILSISQQYELGKRTFFGIQGVKQDRQRGMELLKSASHNGNMYAQTLVKQIDVLRISHRNDGSFLGLN